MLQRGAVTQVQQEELSRFLQQTEDYERMLMRNSQRERRGGSGSSCDQITRMVHMVREHVCVCVWQ